MFDEDTTHEERCTLLREWARNIAKKLEAIEQAVEAKRGEIDRFVETMHYDEEHLANEYKAMASKLEDFECLLDEGYSEIQCTVGEHTDSIDAFVDEEAAEHERRFGD